MAIRVKGIAFDVGNTLVLDPFEGVLALKIMEFERIFAQRGYSIRRDEMTGAWNEANEVVNYHFVSHFYQEPGILVHVMDRLKIQREHRRELMTQLLIAYREGLRYVVTRGETAADVKEVLAELHKRGKRLVAFGDGRQKAAENFLGWLGIRKYFSSVTMSERLGIEKPDFRVFGYMLRILGTSPGESVYIGDNPERDIEPAKRSGMHAILYVPPERNRKRTPWRNYSAECRPDATIHSLKELLDILK